MTIGEENKRSQTILSDSSFTQLKNNLFRWSTLPNGLAFPYQLALQNLQKQTHCSRQMRWSESHFSATAQWAGLKCEWTHRLLNGQAILEKKKYLMFCAIIDCFTWIEKQNKENPVKMELVRHLIFDVQSTETYIRGKQISWKIIQFWSVNPLGKIRVTLSGTATVCAVFSSNSKHWFTTSGRCSTFCNARSVYFHVSKQCASVWAF